MSESESVTEWLVRLKAEGGRDEAVDRLWERYFADLVQRAHAHLQGRRAAADGEDVALSAFAGFVRGVQCGRFPKLGNRQDLWQILLRMTANKAKNAVRRENQEKRGRGWAALGIADGDSAAHGVPLPAADTDPAEVAALVDEVERLLHVLGSTELRLVAELALAEHTNAEIATALGKSVATVERKLARIREIWSGMGYGRGTERPST